MYIYIYIHNQILPQAINHFSFPASEMHDPQFSFMNVLLQFLHNHTGNFNSHLMRPSTNP